LHVLTYQIVFNHTLVTDVGVCFYKQLSHENNRKQLFLFNKLFYFSAVLQKQWCMVIQTLSSCIISRMSLVLSWTRSVFIYRHIVLDYEMIRLYGFVYVCNHCPYVYALKMQSRVEKNVS